jgi:hypothetical protein
VSLSNQHCLREATINDSPHHEKIDWDDLRADLRCPAKA